MSKSLCMQQHYMKANRGQTNLMSFFHVKSPVSEATVSSAADPELPASNHTRSASFLSSPSEDSSGENSGESKDEAILSQPQLEQEGEDWEDELKERMQGQPLKEAITICSWEDLREKIKDEPKKKSLPLRKINQLLIIHNFATLWIKGLSRIGASLEIACQWGIGMLIGCEHWLSIIKPLRHSLLKNREVHQMPDHGCTMKWSKPIHIPGLMHSPSERSPLVNLCMLSTPLFSLISISP